MLLYSNNFKEILTHFPNVPESLYKFKNKDSIRDMIFELVDIYIFTNIAYGNNRLSLCQFLYNQYYEGNISMYDIINLLESHKLSYSTNFIKYINDRNILLKKYTAYYYAELNMDFLLSYDKYICENNKSNFLSRHAFDIYNSYNFGHRFEGEASEFSYMISKVIIGMYIYSFVNKEDIRNRDLRELLSSYNIEKDENLIKSRVDELLKRINSSSKSRWGKDIIDLILSKYSYKDIYLLDSFFESDHSIKKYLSKYLNKESKLEE